MQFLFAVSQCNVDDYLQVKEMTKRHFQKIWLKESLSLSIAIVSSQAYSLEGYICLRLIPHLLFSDAAFLIEMNVNSTRLVYAIKSTQVNVAESPSF